MTVLEQDVMERILDRERRARKEAEFLLEEKSGELFRANEDLRVAAIALREEAKKSSTVLQNAAEGIITFGEQGIIESVNPAACRIFACDSEELIGSDARSLVADPAESTTAELRFSASVEDLPTGPRSCFGRRRDDTVFEMELSASRVQLDDRILFTWMLRDITGKRVLERQLAFAQKMESVGQLAAGIAHEINTPIQYVGNNTNFLGSAFEELVSLIDLYDQLAARCVSDDDNLAELCQQIEERKKAIKLPFLRAEIPPAIEQSRIGATRVGEIVAAMKEFSHPGTQEKTFIDLNKAIESTITISKHEWKYVADVKTELKRDLPQVPCFPGDLNQAILNLIVNAAHAIDESRDDSQRGMITISTSLEGNDAVVRVTDNGVGIPEAIREKIFDLFFTTKPVGKGTGQGLSIVYSVVVEKHGGHIDVESIAGEGTTFVLSLPLEDQSDSTTS